MVCKDEVVLASYHQQSSSGQSSGQGGEYFHPSQDLSAAEDEGITLSADLVCDSLPQGYEVADIIATNMAAVAAAKEIASIPTKLSVMIDSLNTFSRPARIDQHVRKAIEQGQLGTVIECAKLPKRSTISISSPGVLKHTLRGLRSYPQKAKWSEKSVTKALVRSRTVATLLEERKLKDKKLSTLPNTKTPELLGIYLELAAVNAYKHQERKDVNGKVWTAADRLLSGFERNSAWLEKSWTAPKAGQVDVVLEAVPVWHGLSLAQKTLGSKMPQQELAERVIRTYGAGLKQVIEQIKAQDPKAGTYRYEALTAWDACIKE